VPTTIDVNICASSDELDDGDHDPGQHEDHDRDLQPDPDRRHRYPRSLPLIASIAWLICELSCVTVPVSFVSAAMTCCGSLAANAFCARASASC
jgi:hypothetical protein